MDNKFTVYANVVPAAESTAPGAIPLFTVPEEALRQQDLQYITAVFVSSGMNLNGAVFLPSELIHARDTIRSKPLDVEHIEGAIVGHIYDNAFLLKDGTLIDPVQFMVESGSALDRQQIDVAVAMALYKLRFPDVAEDVADGTYKVSMECYYKDFDIKVGDIIISKDEAAAIGISWEGPSSMIGRKAHLRYGGKEVAVSSIGRVLRGIMFSGCGLVLSPANPDSLIREAASEVGRDMSDVSLDIDGVPLLTALFTEASGLAPKTPHSSNPGACVSFKHKVTRYIQPAQNVDGESDISILNPPGVFDTTSQDDVVVHENWCTLFDLECTARPGDATKVSCLRNVAEAEVKSQLLSNDRMTAVYDYMVKRGIKLSGTDQEAVERLRKAIANIVSLVG